MSKEERRRMREIEWSKRIDSVAPPGIGTDWEIKGYLTGLVLFVIMSAIDFIGNYNEAYSDLYHWLFGRQVMIAGAVMPDFVAILDDSLRGFFLYCFLMLAVVVWHYLYYYNGPKSIYLMKRLPNRLEIHKRAWVLPLLGVAATLLAAFVMLVIYFEIYMIVTPKQCITPGQWSKIWR